jgi:hypothetical protein
MELPTASFHGCVNSVNGKMRVVLPGRHVQEQRGCHRLGSGLSIAGSVSLTGEFTTAILQYARPAKRLSRATVPEGTPFRPLRTSVRAWLHEHDHGARVLECTLNRASALGRFEVVLFRIAGPRQNLFHNDRLGVGVILGVLPRLLR